MTRLQHLVLTLLTLAVATTFAYWWATIIYLLVVAP